MRRRPALAPRTGAAVVELGICLPVIFLLMMGSLEVCGRVFLRESLQIAAYEASVVAARQSSTTSSVNARVTSILGARNVNGYTVSCSPSPESAALGSQIVVTVSAPTSSNGLTPAQRFASMTLSAQCTAVKEAR